MKNNLVKGKICFFTGISCSGKSTINSYLKDHNKTYPHSIFLDVDDNGVPDVGREFWRRWRVEELLDIAITNREKGINTFISGFIMPKEILESQLYKYEYGVNIILLHITEKQFELRIKKRMQKSTERRTYENNDINLLIKENLKRRKLFLEQTKSLKNGHILYLSKTNKKQMYAKIKNLWMSISQNKNQ